MRAQKKTHGRGTFDGCDRIFPRWIWFSYLTGIETIQVSSRLEMQDPNAKTMQAVSSGRFA